MESLNPDKFLYNLCYELVMPYFRPFFGPCTHYLNPCSLLQRLPEVSFSYVDLHASNVFADTENFVCFGVLTAVTMKNAVFWDKETQFLPYRRRITSLLLSPAG
jgi:hypothetical protein